MRLLDTNVILRYLTRDDVEKADGCFQLFQRAVHVKGETIRAFVRPWQMLTSQQKLSQRPKELYDDFCIVVAYDCGFAASLSVWESDAANTVIWADHDFDA